jgi:hypothetical protein
MLDYVTKMLDELPEEMNGEAPTPAASHLFSVNEDQIKVSEQKAKSFHTYVAKTLFFMQTGTSQSTNDSSIIMHKSESMRRRRLQEAKTDAPANSCARLKTTT